MSGDDDQFDNDNADSLYPRAPLPPHERQWRHPAEIGAAQTVAIKPASPRSKGLAFVAAIVSMVTTVVFAQVLRPVERGRETVTATSTPASASGSAMPEAPGVFKINGVSFAAVAVSTTNSRRLLISSKEAAVSRSMQLEGDSATLVLAGIDETSGLAIWSTQFDVAATSQIDNATVHVSDPVTVWDGEVFTGSIGVSTHRTSDLALIPLDIPSNVHSGSPVYDTAGNLIGIVMVKSHARLMIPIEAIASHIPVIGTIGAIVDKLGFAPLHRPEGIEVGPVVGTSQFKTGDLITHVGNTPINSLDGLATALQTMSGGNAVFTVVRKNAATQVTVALP